MCTISHNTDRETECHKIKFRDDFKNCLNKCANSFQRANLPHFQQTHLKEKNPEPLHYYKVIAVYLNKYRLISMIRSSAVWQNVTKTLTFQWGKNI